ncbi:GntR family transcriptional regulator [Clostridium hydrogeniformans]|uniref:GntR family transcriptional regulator n=1 Tax=Clostridium hydrogeniformans TaxID=349933 RepID=UPI0004883767|nr:GntR family transcriptional regulator [Clostridium hydrogeniformans]
MDFQFNSKEPIYFQIVNYIKRKIVSGEFEEGEKLPSVRDLARELKVNPNTIQRVYTELENENLVYTQRGLGKFVNGDFKNINKIRKEISTEILDNFIKELRELGFTKDEVINIISERY